MSPAAKLWRVETTGRVQDFLTARVLLRMRRYMPWRSGETASALTMQQSPSMIVVNAPYARYLYYGMKMRDPNGGGPFPIKDANGEFQGEFRYRKGAHPVATGVPLNSLGMEQQGTVSADAILERRRGLVDEAQDLIDARQELGHPGNGWFKYQFETKGNLTEIHLMDNGGAEIPKVYVVSKLTSTELQYYEKDHKNIKFSFSKVVTAK